LKAVKTVAPVAGLGLQSPAVLSAKNYVVVTNKEVDDPRSSAGFRSVFVKRQCMHCEDPACVSACPVTAMHKTAEGPVIYDEDKCIGCRYCLWACPWGVPTAEWDSLAPAISKCTMCYDRLENEAAVARNDVTLTPAERQLAVIQKSIPACVKQCPAGALQYGERDELLVEAHRRIAKNPAAYVDHVYGEFEAGGTGMLYLSPVPFEQIGLQAVGKESYVHTSSVVLGAVPPAAISVGALLGGVYAFSQRREKVALAERAIALVEPAPPVAAPAAVKPAKHHVEFAPVSDMKLLTPSNLLLLALMAYGGISFLLRFALGIGGSTNLSDTYAWGLWIVFDLVWIAIAAGAFATAGIIYVFKRDDLYPIGRTAVFMGLLSYGFVTVTLLADLGLPWHFWQLALNAPRHSAMFEVSWCVGLYVSVLLLEFLPVPFERFGLKKSMESWRQWSPLYVVGAVTLFIYLMSRNFVWTGLALATFSILAYAFRQKPGEKPVPIMLAIAAVTFSSMHQSSLGSLFLLMPDKLDKLWWSPMMPVYFFLSSIAAGTALMVLIDMWIAKAYGRKLRIAQTSAMGQIAFWSLFVYLIVRMADVAVRGQLPNATNPVFLAEIVLGGVVPLVLLSTRKFRENPSLLFSGALLSMLGVIFNRTNVTLFGMTLRGPMPQIQPQSYFPSAVEWGVSIGLIAATIFLFKLGAKYLPILPKEQAHD
jgi:formate dehydrogenase iron-sulfur subunit